MPISSPTARPGVEQLRPSRIREVANAAMGRQDVIAFWFGEPDEVTPDFIRQAAIDSLRAGETFYSQNLGLPELREAIAAYLTRLHRPTPVERIAVTSSGLSALMIATQAVVGAGRPRRRSHPAVAQPGGNSQDPRCARDHRGAALLAAGLDPGSG